MQGQPLSPHYVASRTLTRMQMSAQKRSHKSLPEICHYLLGFPEACVNHSFRRLYYTNLVRKAALRGFCVLCFSLIISGDDPHSTHTSVQLAWTNPVSRFLLNFNFAYSLFSKGFHRLSCKSCNQFSCIRKFTNPQWFLGMCRRLQQTPEARTLVFRERSFIFFSTSTLSRRSSVCRYRICYVDYYTGTFWEAELNITTRWLRWWIHSTVFVMFQGWIGMMVVNNPWSIILREVKGWRWCLLWGSSHLVSG